MIKKVIKLSAKSITEAIYGRRSIRRYKDGPVAKEVIDQLLEAAVLAPSSSNSQPWAFAVIQNKELLDNYSREAKKLMLELKAGQKEYRYRALLADPDYHLFYNAGTLLIIYSTLDTMVAFGDCCLAAQNIMLTAYALGLGTCWIGFSTPYFDRAEVKDQLGIPLGYRAVAPIIVGVPEVVPAGYSRKPPQILTWQK